MENSFPKQVPDWELELEVWSALERDVKPETRQIKVELGTGKRRVAIVFELGARTRRYFL
jgi:hypothetical protein